MKWEWNSCYLELKDSGIGILTFNRPEALNAINIDLTYDVPAACAEVANNPDIKVLIVTGEGKGWSAGGDISTLSAMTDAINAKDTYDHSTGIVKAIYELEKPVIAAVNGPVAGASLATCMACDMIIASEKAVFGFTFMQVAFCADSGTSYFLTQKVGYHKAAEILWNGKILKIDEAQELGLVNTVVPHEELMPTAMKWAERLVKRPLMTIGLDKKLLRASLKNDFYEQAELEALYQIMTWSSEDFKEGAAAFLEKRKPNFKGK